MLKSYYTELKKNYINATGEKGELSINELKQWYLERQSLLQEYAYWIERSTLITNPDLKIIELNKGSLDNVSDYLVDDGFKSLVLSQYFDERDMKERTYYHKGSLKINTANMLELNFEGNLEEMKNKKKSTLLYTTDMFIDDIMNSEDVKNYSMLIPFLSEKKLVLGTYGMAYDKDIDRKIKMIRKLANDLYANDDFDVRNREITSKDRVFSFTEMAPSEKTLRMIKTK